MGRHRQKNALILILVAALGLGGCIFRSEVRENIPAATAAPLPTASPTPTSAPTPSPPAPEITFTPEPTATPVPTPEPTPETTPEPAGQKARRSGGRIVPGEWGAEIPYRAAPADDSFFNSACMIGNSLVQGFQLWSGLHSITCVSSTGATVYSVPKEMRLEILWQNTFTDVYLVFGLNEMGMDVSAFIDNYARIIDYVRAYQPEANIIAVSVTPVMRWVDEAAGTPYKMASIRAYNDALRSLCDEKECWYLDLFSVLLDGEGYLSGFYGYNGDGKHFEPTGYMLWADYLRTHYIDDTLLTE